MYRSNVQVTSYGRQTVPDRDVVRSCEPLQNFWGSNHITGTAEPKVVKFCTRVGYINSSNVMTYHQQKESHVTVLKFCRLSWCSASRGFVSDSWAKLQPQNMVRLFDLRCKITHNRLKLVSVIFGHACVRYDVCSVQCGWVHVCQQPLYLAIMGLWRRQWL